MRLLLVLFVFTLAAVPQGALAAPALDGAAMRWPWALPFIGLLLSIATGPLLFPKVWHDHYGKIAFAWSALTLAPLAALHGEAAALAAFVHAMLAEYLDFIVLLFALYVVAGGILVTGTLRGTPLNNTALLAFGTGIASIVGTTGAAMILIRPLIRANAARLNNVHVIVFFIILVANIGGALSPLGDPPLFIGFLHGVDFFWTTRHIWFQTVLVAGIVLLIFFILDLWHYRKDQRITVVGEEPVRTKIGVRGTINLLLLAAIIGATLGAAAWKPGVTFTVFGTALDARNLARDAALIMIALASLRLTPEEHREANGFSWEPIVEVAKLFAGIFVTIIPVMAMLQAGRNGAFAWLLAAITEPDGKPLEVPYFWLTGMLSAFLDNAPTYLVFFELASGDAQKLMGPLAGTLASISMGAVYMGALTYIGNAPNFMVYAIATGQGIKMPSFFGYFLWASAVLIPLFVLLTLLPVAPILKSG
jgi:Na+/H+ antiporter NhaD/arsenite permease-like protein